MNLMLNKWLVDAFKSSTGNEFRTTSKAILMKALICMPIAPALMVLIFHKNWMANATLIIFSIVVSAVLGVFGLYQQVKNQKPKALIVVCIVYFIVAITVAYVSLSLASYYTFAAGGVV